MRRLRLLLAIPALSLGVYGLVQAAPPGGPKPTTKPAGPPPTTKPVALPPTTKPTTKPAGPPPTTKPTTKPHKKVLQ